jgi:hypothetical protein
VRLCLTDIVVGGAVGAIAGAIVAVNIVITAGVDRGYEATIPEIFQENLLIGTITVMTLASGPVLGVVAARRLRRRRRSSAE